MAILNIQINAQVFSFLPFTSCNSIKGKNKAVNCSVPCGCRHLRPWYSGAECAVHSQNRGPDMNTKLCNDTANTLSHKRRWRLTAVPSIGLNCDHLQGRSPGTNTGHGNIPTICFDNCFICKRLTPPLSSCRVGWKWERQKMAGRVNYRKCTENRWQDLQKVGLQPFFAWPASVSMCVCVSCSGVSYLSESLLGPSSRCVREAGKEDGWTGRQSERG